MFEQDHAISAPLVVAWRQAVKRYLHRDTVKGVAIGRRWQAGRPTKELCVRIHVSEKVARNHLAPRERIPIRLGRMRTDVVEGHFHPHTVGTCPTYAVRTGRADVLQPGFSVGPLQGEAGTLGALVRDGAGNIYLLSARHVLYLAGARTGDPVIQPGRPDGGGADDVVATLAGYTAAAEAAVALINDRRASRPLALDAPMRWNGVRLPVVGDILQKSGRSTCVTEAQVDAIGAYHGYPTAMHLRAAGEDPEAPICAPGDSGSIWYDPNTGQAIGLHVLGDNVTGSSAIATLLASSVLGPGALDSMKVALV